MTDHAIVEQEEEHVSPGPVVLTVLMTVLFGLFLGVAARAELHARQHTFERTQASNIHHLPQDVALRERTRLFARPGGAELLKARQRKQLSSYSWVDKSRGIVRIPIDVAIDLELKESR